MGVVVMVGVVMICVMMGMMVGVVMIGVCG